MNDVKKIADNILKQSGTWSLPDSEKKIKDLEAFIRNIDNPFKELYSILGDDSLYDKFDKIKEVFAEQTKKAILDYLTELIEHFDRSPEDFRSKIDTKRLNEVIKQLKYKM
jgi:hypothetical protein